MAKTILPVDQMKFTYGLPPYQINHKMASCFKF